MRSAALIGLVSAVGAYYVLNGVFGDGFRAIGASHAATVWGAVALLAGPAFGLAGATWRHGHGLARSIAVAVLAAALIAEGVVFGAPRAGPAATRCSPIRVPSCSPPRRPRSRPPVGPASPRRADSSGTLAVAVLAVLAAVAIGPLTTVVLRAIADTF